MLCADPTELMEFISDAILALAAKQQGQSVAGMIELLTQACSIPGTDETLEIIHARWRDIEATLGEHLDKPSSRKRLAQISKEAPWEIPT